MRRIKILKNALNQIQFIMDAFQALYYFYFYPNLEITKCCPSHPPPPSPHQEEYGGINTYTIKSKTVKNGILTTI